MAISLLALVVRHERRVRLVFSDALAAGAFTSTAYYAVTCTSSVGANPSVAAAIQVAGAPNTVDLQLSLDLVEGGVYSVAVTSVPAADASTFTGSNPFTHGVTPGVRTNVEPAKNDLDPLLFGRDLVWTGLDWGETADGDLATVEGLENVCGALHRRIKASGLPWAPDYGPSLDDYVDGAALGATTARGALTSQILRDDRVKACTAKLELREQTDGATHAYFAIDVTLLGGRKPGAFTHRVA